MKSVLISIKPEWCEKIAARWKSMELRKSKPNIPLPFKCYIYQTRFKCVFKLLRTLKMDDIADTLTIGFGKVIGEFVCDHIMGHCEMENADLAESQSYVRREKILEYSGGKEVYGWHISDLKIYDKPKKISEFHTWKKCNSCRKSGYESTACIYDEDCRVPAVITRPPQSWCYVEGE